jgi:hypothetical protein
LNPQHEKPRHLFAADAGAAASLGRLPEEPI